ncbi:MAG: sporulation peptidase YabG [bacterium]|nr:sporulation peptidase YabG [bacterium]
MEFRIGDLVTRISYKHDVVFKIIGFEGNTVFLKGVDLRLIADCEIDDLVKAERGFDDDKEIIEANVRDIKIDRSQYFYLPGKILHIDADIYLSNKLVSSF